MEKQWVYDIRKGFDANRRKLLQIKRAFQFTEPVVYDTELAYFVMTVLA